MTKWIKIFIYLIIFSIPALLNSCYQDSMNECLSGSGNKTVERRGLYPFRNVAVYDNIDLSILQGTTHEVEIEGGQKLIPMISTRVENNYLTISNESTCLMLKDPWTRIKVILTLPDLDTLRINGYSSVTTIDSVCSENIFVFISEGSGDIDLTFSAYRLYVNYNSGTSDVYIRGKGRDVVFYSSGYGPFNCLEYQSQYTVIQSNSTNDCFVNSNNLLLDAKIVNVGNIYYTGEPRKIIKVIEGSGRLIKLDQ